VKNKIKQLTKSERWRSWSIKYLFFLLF